MHAVTHAHTCTRTHTHTHAQSHPQCYSSCLLTALSSVDYNCYTAVRDEVCMHVNVHTQVCACVLHIDIHDKWQMTWVHVRMHLLIPNVSLKVHYDTHTCIHGCKANLCVCVSFLWHACAFTWMSVCVFLHAHVGVFVSPYVFKSVAVFLKQFSLHLPDRQTSHCSAPFCSAMTHT